ncbi:MAG TPA: hypothetical protein VG456_24970 [Candidatus Sulfopaludibacter sp.]|jgi:hypothetical protein|nr:hypothetical protein [Candidatus Sulfopaludibacter sp.]
MSETPILDLEIDPPRLSRPWITWLVGGAIGVVLSFAKLPFSIDGLWWFPVLYASIAVHEVGHLVAGKLVGMESGGLVIGGLMILKSGQRWVVRFEWRRILSGGFAKPLPKKTELDIPRYAWMLAGGPLATLLLVAASGIPYWRSTATAPGWLSSFFWINVLLAVSLILPSRGLNKSDGARLWLLLRNPSEARSWIAVLQLQTEETEGMLPRDWDPALVAEMLQGCAANGDNAYRHMLVFYRCIDLGDEEAALAHLEKALAASARCGRPARLWCFLEAAACSGLMRGDPEQARTWLARAVKVSKPQSKSSVEAAIAMAEHRYEDALRLWDESLAFLAKRRLDSGLIRFTKLKIAEYQAECRTSLVSK